jgi:hypothetical protein
MVTREIEERRVRVRGGLPVEQLLEPKIMSFMRREWEVSR